MKYYLENLQSVSIIERNNNFSYVFEKSKATGIPDYNVF